MHLSSGESSYVGFVATCRVSKATAELAISRFFSDASATEITEDTEVALWWLLDQVPVVLGETLSPLWQAARYFRSRIRQNSDCLLSRTSEFWRNQLLSVLGGRFPLDQ
ncbi:hypothetical protein RBWH47_03074 [Rhodopirellula baltica WH47]|uniref:Uncharacterized protein n=1 Tax=Rhodopirellula baltica WH47 TaxID=991778 RepID=F2AMZ2_RHOBT|nr:hypothetical protein RBWH47_03074 [Rhodopirellula baltica WH47]